MYVVSKTENFAKLFLIVSFTGLFTYVVLAFYTFHTAFTSVNRLRKIQERVKNLPDTDLNYNDDRIDKDLKYILQWTTLNANVLPMGQGQQPFVDRNCSFINCFLTTDKGLLNGDYANFDSIILDIPVLKTWKYMELPQTRTPRQKYVFYGHASSDDYPICNVKADDYFNWTWSYKLYSDIFNPFIEVRDLKDNIIAPNINVEWVPNMEYLTKQETNNLMVRRKMVAWKMNRCETKIDRMKFAKELKYVLRRQNLTFDIYGCGNEPCPKGSCIKSFNEYYFYLVYEDSIAEDYVTDEVLKAYDHGAVPIMIGGAEYSKFLPPGSYINARHLTAEKLAAILDYSMRIPIVYSTYHRWRKYYTVHRVDVFKGLCQLCNYLNNENRVKTYSHYETFRMWWFMGPLIENCYPKSSEKFSDGLSYINMTGLFGRRRSNSSTL